MMFILRASYIHEPNLSWHSCLSKGKYFTSTPHRLVNIIGLAQVAVPLEYKVIPER